MRSGRVIRSDISQIGWDPRDTMNNTGRDRNTDMMKQEKREVLTNALVTTIADKISNTNDAKECLDVLVELRKVMFRQKKAFIMDMDAAEVKNEIQRRIKELRAGSAELEVLVEKEVLGELTTEDVYAFLAETGDSDSASDAMIISILDTDSNTEFRDHIQGGWGAVNAELDRLERIAALETDAAQHRAFANHEAETESQTFESHIGLVILEKIGMSSQAQSLPVNIADLISEYLDRMCISELEILLQMLENENY